MFIDVHCHVDMLEDAGSAILRARRENVKIIVVNGVNPRHNRAILGLAAHYPEIKFESTSFKKVSGEDYKLTGNLTMKGVTKPVEIDAEFGGSAKDAYGNVKYGFELTGKINRKEFGVSYNALTETGGLALGEDIKLIANIQLVQAN